MISVSTADPNWQALYDTAAAQAGLFTTRQAGAAGFDRLLARIVTVLARKVECHAGRYDRRALQ
jgi:hypothetical protein